MDLYLAPLAEITSKEFRTLCYEGGADICYSEMISAKAITLKNKKTFSLTELEKGEEKTFLQFFGHEPEVMKEAVETVLSRVAPFGIDINAGCPVRKVISNKAGSALMANPQNLGAIVKAVRSVTNLPLSVKIRKGFKTPNYLECAKIVEDNGADLIVVHPRLQPEMFSGTCDHNVSIELSEIMKIPVIHSGDIRRFEDLKRFNDSNVKGVMVGRGAIGAPWIFNEIKGKTVDVEEKKSVMTKHFRFYVAMGENKFAHTMIRRHGSWYSAGMGGSSEFRNKIFSKSTSIDEVLEMIRVFFGIDL